MSDFDSLGFQEHGSSTDFEKIGFTPHSDERREADSWLDKKIPGGTPRGYIQGTLNTLPAVGMVGGGMAAGAAGFVAPIPGGAALGAAAGGSLGDAAGEALKNLGEKYILGQNKSRSEIYGNPAKGLMEGGAGEMGGQSIGKVLESAPVAGKWAAQKTGKIFANVPEETTARYLENPAAINSAPTREKIADDILSMKNKASDALSAAEEKLLKAKSDLSENKIDVRSGLQDQRFQYGTELQDAQQSFNEKKQAFKEALQNQSLTSMAADVSSARMDLKDQIKQGSKEAYEILDKDPRAYSVRGAAPILRATADEMNIQAFKTGVTPDDKALAAPYDAFRAKQFGAGSSSPPITAQTAGVQAELRSFADRLENTPKTVPARELKKMLQQIDNSEKAMYGQPGFDSRVSRAYKMVRGVIDDGIKAENPEYAEKMDSVARKTKILDTTSDLYGTPAKTISNLNNITSEKGQALHFPLLQALGKETGRDLSAPVSDYLTNQKILSTPSLFDKAIEKIPEAKTLASARAKMAEISNPEYSRSISESANTPLQKNIGAAQSAVDKAKEGREVFSGITPDSVTSKTKALNGANSYGAEQRFGNLDKALGTDFEKQINSRNDLDQFAKSDTAGSRKTLLGGAVGGAIGVATGKPIEGAAIGSAIGQAADRYSGPIFKYGLDTAMALGAGAKAIPKSTLGAAVEPRLSVVPPGGAAAAKNQPTKGPEKWQADGLQKLQDHVKTDDDKELLDKAKSQLMTTPDGKKLLIAASDLKPGSKAMEDVMSKIKQKFQKGGE